MHRPEAGGGNASDASDASDARSAQAAAELGHTAVDRTVALTLVVAFLLAIALVPAIDLLGRRVGEPVARVLGDAMDAGATGVVRAAVARREELADALKEASVTGILLAPAQLVVTALGGGSEEVYPGRDGWLYHRPAVEHLTGRGFLDPARLRRLTLAGDSRRDPPQPDPRPAILDFHRQLAARGIALLVVPTPVKPALHPERMSTRFADADRPLYNPSFARLVTELEAAGVAVLDPAPLLAAGSQPRFLRTDTHWTPEGMAMTARAIAARVEALAGAGDGPPFRYRRAAEHRTGTGDLSRMLGLPESAIAHESVTAERVTRTPPEAGRPEPPPDVLLLGDSFTNQYADPSLGWGDGAGLAEHLGLYLGHPVERIAQNGDGAIATRRRLAQELARASDRLAGKRVVVWQFSAPELSFGDWRQVDLGAPEAASPAAGRRPVAMDSTPVTGVVRAVTPVPPPRSQPYRDCITSIHLTDVAGLEGTSELLLYTWGMRGDAWTDAARLPPGRRLRLGVRPWSAVADELGAYQRLEPLDDRVLFLDPYWTAELR